MTRDPSTYAEYEYRAELEHVVTPGGTRYSALRVTWRRQGARRWESFLLVPDAGEPFESFCAKVGPAIDETAHGFRSLGRG